MGVGTGQGYHKCGRHGDAGVKGERDMSGDAMTALVTAAQNRVKGGLDTAECIYQRWGGELEALYWEAPKAQCALSTLRNLLRD